MGHLLSEDWFGIDIVLDRGSDYSQFFKISSQKLLRLAPMDCASGTDGGRGSRTEGAKMRQRRIFHVVHPEKTKFGSNKYIYIPQKRKWKQ